MAIIDLVMPKLGESIMEATILKWHKKVGDNVALDETILEIATDKVDSEIPSTHAGVIEEILYNVNDVVKIGLPIVKINVGGAANNNVPSNSSTNNSNTEPDIQVPFVPEANNNMTTSNNNTNTNKFYSPLVLNIANSENVSMQELEKINGTGNEGRVTKKDILDYVENRKKAPVATAQHNTNSKPEVQTNNTQIQQPVAVQAKEELVVEIDPSVEIVEMDRMRKLIADHMVKSKHTSPHVTSFTEADVTNLVQWRESIKKSYEQREGDKITFTPLFIEAVARCIKKFPLINCSVDGTKIIIKKDINIGMATALPTGNLIVPVIKNADQFNLVGLSKKVNSLAAAARNNKLKIDDTQGGTFTLTNVGTFGSLMGTPIINQPQVAILAVGAIKKRPVVIETPHGDSIAIRHMMYLSLSYDHRIVDGSLGATFLTAVANELESFNRNREW